MADEVIKIIEYITGNPIVQGLFALGIGFSVIVATLTFVFFVFVFRSILNSEKRWR